MTLTPHLSGWAFGKIVFGGFIGLAVDAISGGLYQFTPDQVVEKCVKATSRFQRPAMKLLSQSSCILILPGHKLAI